MKPYSLRCWPDSSRRMETPSSPGIPKKVGNFYETKHESHDIGDYCKFILATTLVLWIGHLQMHLYS